MSSLSNIMDTTDGGNNNGGGSSLRDHQFQLLQQLSLQILQLVAKNNTDNPNNNNNGLMIQLLRQLIEQSMGSQQAQQQYQSDPSPNSSSINAAGFNGSTMSFPSSVAAAPSSNQFGTNMPNGVPAAARSTQQLPAMQQGGGRQSQQGDGNSELLARLGQLLSAQNQQGSSSGASTAATSRATAADTQASTFYSQGSQATSSSSAAPAIQGYSHPSNTTLTPNLFGQLVPQQQQPPVAQPQQQQAPDAVAALISLLQNASGQNGAAAANLNNAYHGVPQQQHAIREVNVPIGYPMTNIEFPGPHDVVLGRGRGASGHIGNVKFRAFIKRYKPKYAAANRIDKPKVAEEVVAKWRVKDPPGRFLVQVRTTDRNVWNDVGDRKARQKTSQSLREKEMTREEQQRQQQQRNRDGGTAEVSGDSTSIASTGEGESESETEAQNSSGNSTGDCQERTSTDGSGQEEATRNTVRVSVGGSGSSDNGSEQT